MGPSGYAAKLARYTSAGELDPSFGQDGVVTPAFGRINSGFIAIAEDHGKILAAGGVTFVASTRAIAVRTYNSDGTPDFTFGNNGIVITDLPSHWAYARAIAVSPDAGYIYVAGYFTENDVTSPGVLRYTSNGTLDTTLGGDRSVAFPNNGGGAYGATPCKPMASSSPSEQERRRGGQFLRHSLECRWSLR